MHLSKSNFIKQAVLIILLTSCNKGNDTNTAPQLVRTFNDRKASCKFQFQDGGTAPAMLPVKNIVASSFEKKYDKSLLEAVINASGFETERFAKLTGVTYYKVANTAAEYGCPFTTSLPQAIPAIEKEFRDAEADVQKINAKVTLEGFYLDEQMVTNITNAESNKPLIVLKDDSDRYTMVHEFMHHLYQLEKPITGYQSQVLYSRSTDVFSDSIDDYEKNETTENLKNIVNKLEIRVLDFILVQKNYPLEEMANETELNKKFELGLFRFISRSERANGDWYIISSADKAKLRIEKTKKLIQSILSEINAKIPDDSLIQTQISSMFILLNDLSTEIKILESAAQSRVDYRRKSNSSLNALVFESTLMHTKICNHSHGIDMFLDQIESKISKHKKFKD